MSIYPEGLNEKLDIRANQHTGQIVDPPEGLIQAGDQDDLLSCRNCLNFIEYIEKESKDIEGFNLGYCAISTHLFDSLKSTLKVEDEELTEFAENCAFFDDSKVETNVIRRDLRVVVERLKLLEDSSVGVNEKVSAFFNNLDERLKKIESSHNLFNKLVKWFRF